MYRSASHYLKKWLHDDKRKPLIIRGARQVGKSTLVRNFALENNLDLCEINLERFPELKTEFKTFNLKKICTSIEHIIGKEIDVKKSLLFLDEVQAIPEAIAMLRYFYEEMPDLHVISAGSLLEFVLSDHNFSMPVGRVEFLYLYPLSFQEFLIARDEKYLLKKMNAFDYQNKKMETTLENKIIEQLRDYIFVGGMPEVVHAFIKKQSKEKIRKLQNNIIETYQNDFAKYSKKKDYERLQLIFPKLPFSLGKKIKYSEILLEERSSNIKNCLTLLEKAGIIHFVYHTDCNGIPLRSQMDRHVFKIYWLDIGLLNQMLGLNWHEIQTNDRLIHEGILAEQFVAQELIVHDHSGIKPQLLYWLREGKKGNAEIDFVIQKGMEIIPLEVKSGKSGKMKSLVHFLHYKKLNKAIKLSLKSDGKKNVEHKLETEDGNKNVKFNLLELGLYFTDKVFN